MHIIEKQKSSQLYKLSKVNNQPRDLRKYKGDSLGYLKQIFAKLICKFTYIIVFPKKYAGH